MATLGMNHIGIYEWFNGNHMVYDYLSLVESANGTTGGCDWVHHSYP